MLLILLVVLGIVAIIVLNILKVNCRASSLPPAHSCLLAWEHACGQPCSAHLPCAAWLLTACPRLCLFAGARSQPARGECKKLLCC